MQLKYLILLFVSCSLIKNSTAQEIYFPTDSIDKYVHQALEGWQLPGAAVCIVKDGKILLQKGYGVSNWETQSKVDEHTVFPIASISKTFTGTLFATLEAEGKVSLNDPVKRWLPEFGMKDKLYEQQITLADVLSHRSGWKTFQGDLLNTETTLAYAEMIQKFGQQTPAYPFRTRFGYSNFGFIIAGECVKGITQQSWNSYLLNRFLRPLGMTRTLVSEHDIKQETNRAAGHSLVNGKLVVLPPDKIEPYSHGGNFSSIHDLGIWMNVLLNKGNLNGKNIIPEDAITRMWQSQTIIGKARAANREFYFKTYGLGWEITQYGTKEIVHHNGAYSGALTSLMLVPELKLGIAILTNQDSHMLHETLKWQVIDTFLGKNVPNYTQTTIDRHNKRKAEAVAGIKGAETKAETFATALEAISGRYTCEAYGNATIKKEAKDFVLTLEHHPQLQGVFSFYSKDKLTCTYNHPMFGQVQFPFVIENGKVKSFTLFVDGFVEPDGYEFKKVK